MAEIMRKFAPERASAGENLDRSNNRAIKQASRSMEVRMKRFIFIAAMLATLPALGIAADTATKTAAKPARSAVDPAKEAEHMKADVERHRIMAAAHEAAAKCQESGKD